MLEALTINNGVVSDAAQQAGIHRKTHYDWLRNDEDYRKMSLQETMKALSLQERKQKKIKKIISPKRKNTSGYVYLVHCKGTTFYKIGISKLDYHLRLSALQSGCPFELEMIYVIHSSNYRKSEQEVHHKFRDKCVRGEWFDLDEASLNTVMKYLEDTHQPQMQIDFQSQTTSDNSDAS